MTTRLDVDLATRKVLGSGSIHAAGMLDVLPDVVRGLRVSRGLSIRQAATQIGINFSTLDRLERRATDTRISVARACLLWMAAGDEAPGGES